MREVVDIVIIGAGELGATLAHILARAEAARTIGLVDDAGQIAAGKALDIMQAAPIEGFSAQVSGRSDPAMPVAADITVVADRARGGEWQGDDGILLLKTLRRVMEHGIVICAGATQRDLIERGVIELGYARERLIGTAPEALAAALRAMVAIEADGSPQDVALTVLGVPPDQVVIPWEEVTIGGFRATSVLDHAARRRMAARAGPLWPPGPIALASGAAKAIHSIVGRSRRSVCAFMAPDHSSGQRTRTAAQPVRLGADGVAHVERVTLSTHERVALQNAIDL
jgi:malate dehydrogenase